MKRTLLIQITLLTLQHAFGQQTQYQPIYSVNRTVELSSTLGLFAYNAVGFKLLNSKPRLDSLEIASLDASSIWAFDRAATEQSAADRHNAADISDVAMNASLVVPFFLLFDETVRRDWANLLFLYAETQAINTAFYVMTAGAFDRKRPFVYNQDVSIDDKMGPGTRISFFSGHVSTPAAASFFAAKVYCDYHPEIGAKKYWLYTAALIPPAVVGYYRFKAMKHFPTDVITGTLVGAATGVLIPLLHKIKVGNDNLSLLPFAGRTTGVRINYSFN